MCACVIQFVSTLVCFSVSVSMCVSVSALLSAGVFAHARVCAVWPCARACRAVGRRAGLLSVLVRLPVWSGCPGGVRAGEHCCSVPAAPDAPPPSWAPHTYTSAEIKGGFQRGWDEVLRAQDHNHVEPTTTLLPENKCRIQEWAGDLGLLWGTSLGWFN